MTNINIDSLIKFLESLYPGSYISIDYSRHNPQVYRDGKRKREIDGKWELYIAAEGIFEFQTLRELVEYVKHLSRQESTNAKS